MPNESKNIFSVKINDLKEAGVNRISLLNNVDIIINYKSLYEEDFVAELKRTDN